MASEENEHEQTPPNEEEEDTPDDINNVDEGKEAAENVEEKEEKDESKGIAEENEENIEEPNEASEAKESAPVDEGRKQSAKAAQSMPIPPNPCRICAERELTCNHKPCSDCRRRKIRCKCREQQAEAELRAANNGELPPAIKTIDYSRKKKYIDAKPGSKPPSSSSCRVCQILTQVCTHQACKECRQRRVRCKHREQEAVDEIPDEATRMGVVDSLASFKPSKRPSSITDPKLPKKKTKRKKMRSSGGSPGTIGFAEGRYVQFTPDTTEESLTNCLKEKDAIFQDIYGEDTNALLTWINAKLLKCGRTAEDSLMRCYFLGCPIEERFHYDISAAIYDMLELVGLYFGYSPSTIGVKQYVHLMQILIEAAFHEHYDPPGVALNIVKDCCASVRLHGKGGRVLVEIQEAGQFWRLAEVPVKCNTHPQKAKDTSASVIKILSEEEIFREVKVMIPDKKLELLSELAESLASTMGSEAMVEAFNSILQPYKKRKPKTPTSKTPKSKTKTPKTPKTDEVQEAKVNEEDDDDLISMQI
mmetsp:Transcript_25612/g.33523  ORF Transcript_25612/g.33523 Transcript_25612/m.33523 type:complete len:533 (+) Transcript_25612:79-1677(+)